MSDFKDWYAQGREYQINKEFKKSIECYERAVEIDPNDVIAWNNMGSAYDDLKNYERAIECYERAIEIDPKYATAWNNMGAAYDDLKKYEKAIECYERAVEINPNHSKALNNLKKIKELRNKKEIEKEIFEREEERASELDEDTLDQLETSALLDQSPEVWFRLGNIFMKRKNHKKAIDCYEKAIEINPKFTDAWNNMGEVYVEIDNYEKAIECHKKAVEVNPNSADTWHTLGFQYELLEKYEKAIECYEKVLEIDPNYITAQIDLDDVINKLQDKELKDVREGKEIDKQEKIKNQEEPYIIKTPEDIKRKEKSYITGQIFVGCAGIWEVNTLKFKVKVQNNTKYSITDVKVILDKHPSMLQLESNIVKTAHKLGPSGEFWSPEFQLAAGNACVSGTIRAIVRYYDHEEQDHTINIRPYEISYICPLLEAKKINEENYLKKKKNMYSQEQQLIFEPISDIDQFKKEMKEKMEGMNLAVIDLKGSVGEMVGYAEDKFHHDGLGLEAKIESMLDGQTEILLNLKAICEREDKCSPLLYKTLQELSTLGLSVEKGQIMQKLDMFIESPNDLKRYITRVIKSDWPEAKKDKWAEVIREILEDWKEFKPKKWQKIAKVILKIVLGKVVGEELSGYFTAGIQNLFEWIKTNLS